MSAGYCIRGAQSDTLSVLHNEFVVYVVVAWPTVYAVTARIASILSNRKTLVTPHVQDAHLINNKTGTLSRFDFTIPQPCLQPDTRKATS